MSEKKEDITVNEDIEKDAAEVKSEKPADKKAEKKKASEELESTKKELEETKNKYLLMLAEYDNFRKRSQKERENAYSDAYADAVKALLPVFDNIERAGAFADSENTAKGLEMIVNQFKNVLSSLGIEQFGEVHESFDPNIHNAVMQVEDETFGENEIAEVLQKGYRRGDKIIRFAMVKVANCG